MSIRKVVETDWNDIARIYKQGIDSKIATFQEYVPSYKEWSNKYVEGLKLVFEEENKVLGFAALSKVSDRFVYRGVAVLTIYVDENSRGKGVGTSLSATCC